MNKALKITILGTGTSSGVPMIACKCSVCTSSDPRDKRLRSSILIESKKTTFVIDTTPDFRTQMLNADCGKLDAVLFTHPHKDHIAGLDDIRAYNYVMRQPMKVYANALTAETLMREFAYAFADKKYPGIPEIDLSIIDESPLTIGDIDVTPIVVWHHKMPVYGFRMNDFTYITDANRIDDAEKEKIKGTKVLIVNALRKESHLSHFTLDEAIALVDELEVPQAYFTHISHQLGRHEEEEKHLPSHIKLAYDGLVLNV